MSSIQLWRAARVAAGAGKRRAVGSGGSLVRMGQEQSHSSWGVLSAVELNDMGCWVADLMRGRPSG